MQPQQIQTVTVEKTAPQPPQIVYEERVVPKVVYEKRIVPQVVIEKKIVPETIVVQKTIQPAPVTTTFTKEVNKYIREMLNVPFWNIYGIGCNV